MHVLHVSVSLLIFIGWCALWTYHWKVVKPVRIKLAVGSLGIKLAVTVLAFGVVAYWGLDAETDNGRNISELAMTQYLLFMLLTTFTDFFPFNRTKRSIAATSVFVAITMLATGFFIVALFQKWI